MKNVNEGLIIAARNGDEAGLKALLLRPGCDPMSRDGVGMTALMLAADNGHASCIELLIPMSSALSKNKYGMTASELARKQGHASLAAFIDAYGLALIEMSTLHALASPGAPPKKTSLRV